MRTFFLKTERIGFSKWTKFDTELADALWSDTSVARYLCAAGRFSREEIEKRLAREIENDEIYGIQYWPLFSLNESDFLGCCGLRPKDIDSGVYEIGFHLMPEHWGKGYATEAALAVIRYAFENLHANNLFAGHHPGNQVSGKLLQKLHFHPLGDVFYEPTGLFHPSYQYKL